MTRIVVVGGGIVGCSASAFLAEAGADVILLESTAIGAGASGRNSGAVQHPFDSVLAALHRETLEVYRSLLGFDLPAEPAGLLLLTDDADAAAARAGDLARLHPELVPELLEPNDLAAAEPILVRGLSAVRLATGYPIAPEAAVRAFERRAAASGAAVRIGAPVAAVDASAGRVAGVRLVDGTLLEADAVLIAAGPWTPDLLGPWSSVRPIVRTWGVTVQVEMAQAPRHVLEEGVVHTVNTTVDDGPDLRGVESLFSMVAVDSVGTVGSTFLASEPDPANVAPLLVERGARLLPSLGNARVLRHRVCARPQSIDGRPMVGWISGIERLAVCAGHGPWGISTAPASARMAADLLLGGAPDIPAELDPARFDGGGISRHA